MQVGTIEGKVDTSQFEFRAVEEIRKFDFVSIKSNEQWILAQVDEVVKHPDGETIAKANIIGYRDKGLTKAPRRVIEPDSIVYQADQELISDTLGLEDAGLQIGNLETNEDIDIHVDSEDFYKHFSVLAQTGAGKSYLTSVLTEELLDEGIPLIVIDPHGEYSSLGIPNPENDEKSKSYDFREYSPNTDINTEAMPLSFSSVNLSKKELMTLIPDSLTNSQMGVLYNALKKLKADEDDYTLLDIEDAVSHEDSTAKWNLLNYLEQIEESGLLSKNPIELEELLEPGRATIINLKAVEPENAEMTVYLLAKKLFDLRKKNQIPPFLMIMEEAHNFVPEKGFGQAVSNPIMRKIASEGRKFGLGIGVISQRPARIDKNVLSQCNTQFILRVTNPNDLKAISRSFEGITSEVEAMIKSLPPGVAFALGNEYPVMTEVRTRYSKHGGETQTQENYVQTQGITYFQPKTSLQELKQETNENFDVAYYPLYKVETEDEIKLIDGVSGEEKTSRPVLADNEKRVMSLIKEGKDKSEIMEDLDLSITKVTSIVESLRDKGVVDSEALQVGENMLDQETTAGQVEQEKIIDFEYEFSEDDIGVEKVYYPYYSKEDKVYDPVIDNYLD